MRHRLVVFLVACLFFAAATLSYSGGGTVNAVNLDCDGDESLTVNVQTEHDGNEPLDAAIDVYGADD